MSAVAAPAVVLDHDIWEGVDNSVDDVPGGGLRRQLRSVPAQGGPVPKRAAGHPLSLGPDARARLGGAVRMLLDAAGLDGASDAVRLAVLVLASRTPSETGVVEIHTSELGRWIGMSRSYTASVVVPALRRSGVVSVETAEGDYGQDAGLKCKVQPLWEAQGVLGHPLRLVKKEYVTLKRLMQAVMGPGWTHRDGRVTPAGLIGTRTGRGAATERLALLLLVLEAQATGRVRLCGGSVDTKRGRAAATLARLMGCTAAAAAGILGRLEDRELVFRVRLKTASGLANRSRLLVPAVAAAHGRSGADVVREDRAGAVEPVFSERGVAAGRSEPSQADEEAQVSGAPVADGSDVADPGVAAALHTYHPPLVTPGSPLSLSDGFSGEGRGGFGDLPDRACEREDQTVDGEGGPLRGEQPKNPPSIEGGKGSCGPVAGGSLRVLEGEGQGRQQQGRVTLPSLDLRAVLTPVKLVWARLERPAVRRLVEAKVRTELARMVGFAGPTDAPQILADRLARRLETQMQLGGPITDPVGWLIGRGLPQIRLCAEPRCDEGALLDSGRDCPRCEDRQIDSRATRNAVAAAVDAAMPGASETERRAATDRQLHETVTARAWAKASEWEQYRARKAEAKAARAEAAAAQPADDVLAASLAPVALPAPRPAAAAPALEPETADVADDQELVLEELTADQVRDWRVRAMKDHQVLFDHIDHYGEPSARRLFSNQLIDQAQHHARLGHLNLSYSTWEQL
ncbi:hypothetical protein OG890_38820 [Streptomyces anulatus]|uniref:hypothetical protein n=1 Tax=Streptomyces anulatus TaxID=1892 RepID=UPI00225B3483|nr:hypothetical protein [Streptomyces anulatus]MCX4489800.1 hypothetical protein [Streptomyces anulatus]MCX4489843.1 hypothetical protein [Streptomyces anulatus]MCX4523677.1 hypothetical protein [Streptomyces anulatus]MCX4523806.1 hypothetical protein [Streptomyces anulatus]MCX4606684.1 hypothetical protein [Streptomyces anulatus]